MTFLRGRASRAAAASPEVYQTGPRLPDSGALYELSGRSALEMVAETAVHFPPAVWLAASGAIGGAAVLLAARALERRRRIGARLEAPSPLALAGGCALAAALGAAVLGAPGPLAETIQFGVGKKLGALLLRALVEHASDFDRDGAGWLSRPADPAPFDARIHPYALDVPGNGSDEDGLAGDLPLDFELAANSAPVPEPGEGARPWVLLAFLETSAAT